MRELYCRISKQWGFVFLVFMGGSAVVQAAPNGLTQIPIAKVFGNGVASFSIERAVQSSQTTTYTTQYGLFNQFEVGVDYQAAPSDQRTFLGNAKFLIAHKPGRLPDIAFGLQNIATGQKAVPYVVATTQPKATGFSIGTIRPNAGDAYYAMYGISYNTSPNFEIVADEIAGHNNYATIGAIADLTKTITLNVAYAQPNTSENPRGYIVNLDYTFHLTKDKSQESNTANKNSTASSSQ